MSSRDEWPSSSSRHLHSKQGRFEEAETTLRRSLEITERKNGPRRLSAAITLNNLAGVSVERGRYADAERSYRRALEIVEGPRTT